MFSFERVRESPRGQSSQHDPRCASKVELTRFAFRRHFQTPGSLATVVLGSHCETLRGSGRTRVDSRRPFGLRNSPGDEGEHALVLAPGAFERLEPGEDVVRPASGKDDTCRSVTTYQGPLAARLFTAADVHVHLGH